jgi:hypothetical protein
LVLVAWSVSVSAVRILMFVTLALSAGLEEVYRDYSGVYIVLEHFKLSAQPLGMIGYDVSPRMTSRDLISQILANGIPPNGPITAPYYAPKCPHYCPKACPPKYPHCCSIVCPQMALLLLDTIPPNAPIVAPWCAPKWPGMLPNSTIAALYYVLLNGPITAP